MKALILAAGYAKRLYPITKDFPKPLLSVGQRPIINYIVDKLEVLDSVDEIAVITNSKFFQYFKKWAKTLRSSKPISLIDDLTRSHADKRGAIGDLYFAIQKKRLKDDLLVIGGDNLFDGKLEDFLSFARIHKRHPLIGIFNIRSRKLAKGYGVVKLNRKKILVDFQEKPRRPKSALVAMCLYYFPKEKLNRIREYMIDKKADKHKHDATGFYINWLMQKESVFGFVFSGRWYDIGHHDFYRQARHNFA